MPKPPSGGLLIPFDGFDIVFWNAETMLILLSEVGLSLGVSLRSILFELLKSSFG